MSYEWLSFQSLLAGYEPPLRHTLFTGQGTGVDMWTGFPADTARALGDEQFYWQPINYPAATFPMGPSVAAGIAELVRQIDLHPGTFFMLGYSQFAIVVATVWRDYLLNPNGSLHHRLQDCLGIVTWGDPMRAPGIANGNVFAGDPIPGQADGVTTGGIAGPQDLTAAQTPDFYLSFAHPGDLYASAPVGDTPTAEPQVGQYETLIYNLIQNVTLGDVLTIAETVVQLLTVPLAYAVALVEALLNGGLFFAAGMNSPHFTYTINAAVTWLQQRAAAIPARAA